MGVDPQVVVGDTQTGVHHLFVGKQSATSVESWVTLLESAEMVMVEEAGAGEGMVVVGVTVVVAATVVMTEEVEEEVVDMTVVAIAMHQIAEGVLSMNREDDAGVLLMSVAAPGAAAQAVEHHVYHQN